MIDNWSLWEHTTMENRGKQKLITYVWEEEQIKSLRIILLYQTGIIV